MQKALLHLGTRGLNLFARGSRGVMEQGLQAHAGESVNSAQVPEERA